VATVLIADAIEPNGAARDDPGRAEPFDEYRGGLGFRLVLAARAIAALGGTLSSPDTARGRLSLLVSLPLAPPQENAR
jgi:hypothetical protein